MTTWGSGAVSCAEEAGSQNESYDDERGILRASVQLRCVYGDRHALVADICGTRRQWPKGAAGQVPRAATASIVPVVSPHDTLAVDGEILIYKEALVTINYTTEIVDVISESIEPTAEFVTQDYKLFRWGSANGDPLREEEAPGKLVRGINFVRTELNLSTIDASLLSLVGSINQSAIIGTLLSFTFAAETLLYAPPTISYKKDSTNVIKFDVTKKFSYNQNGWNKFYRPYSGAYERIYIAGGGQYDNYPVADLSGLVA